MKCPKCGSEMELGVAVDQAATMGGGTRSTGQIWGTKITRGMLSMEVQNAKFISTYRCKNCGYLESYAK